MTSDADLEMIIADLGSVFLEDCSHRLDTVDHFINQISDRVGNHDHHVMDIERIIHSIKGAAGGAGFPVVVHIAHAFEDYINLADQQARIAVDDCRDFVNAIRFVSIKRGQLNEKQVSNILEGLPLPGCGEGQRGKRVKGHIIFVLPKGLRRQVISRELASFGFRITNAENIVQTIDFALYLKPDLVITAMDLEEANGLELAAALSSFSCLAHTQIAVLSALSASHIEQMTTPKNTTLLTGGSSLSVQLLKFIRSSGLT